MYIHSLYLVSSNKDRCIQTFEMIALLGTLLLPDCFNSYMVLVDINSFLCTILSVTDKVEWIVIYTMVSTIMAHDSNCIH